MPGSDAVRILVTGATGNVGRLVVAQLAEAGASVLALTRNPKTAAFPPGVQVIQGDLKRPEKLTAALESVKSIYLFPVPATVRKVVALARKSGVRRIVVLSSGAVEGGADTSFHLPVERAVEESGLDWTHIRPGEFMLNKLWLWGPSIRSERVVRDPFPEAAWYPVHEQDIADVASVALLEDNLIGKACTLNGPELISHRNQVSAIAEAIGEQIRFEQVTPQQARKLYLKQGGFAAANADFLLGFRDYSGGKSNPESKAHFNPHSLPPMPTAKPVTGRTRTFAEWACNHVQDFR